MSDCATEDANSMQAAQTEDLNQQIAGQKARLAEQERLLHSARLRYRNYSDASLFAFEERERRQDLWAKIIEQPHHKYLDSGHLPDGSIVDLILDANDESKTKFICYQPPQEKDGEPQIAYSEILASSGHAYLPPQFDPNLLRSIRIPVEAEPYESLAQLISEISKLILRCVALSETDARLLAHFVLATWLIDRLPVAPYLALVGPPQSGKTTLLRVLHLLCRRSLLASDATCITLLHACNQLHPTLLIDETSGIEDRVALRRLLRVGNTPGSLVLRHKQAWNVFGAKVICWRELPDNGPLNSLCIILPMHGVDDPTLRLPDDPEIVAAAAALQSQLLYYRLANYENVGVHRGGPGFQARVSEADFAERKMPPRARNLYLALAAPCFNDEESSRFLLDYLSDHFPLTHNEDSLSGAEHAVLTALFHSAHLPQNRGQVLIKELTAHGNRYLQNEGERLHITPRHAGAILASFGFTRRRRMNHGCALLLEKEDQRRLHQAAERYGADSRDNGFVACSLCPDVPPLDRLPVIGVITG
jgi:hypothetical protein